MVLNKSFGFNILLYVIVVLRLVRRPFLLLIILVKKQNKTKPNQTKKTKNKNKKTKQNKTKKKKKHGKSLITPGFLLLQTSL